MAGVAADIGRCGSIAADRPTFAVAGASTGRPDTVLAAEDAEGEAEWVASTGASRRNRIAIIATTASRQCSRISRSASNSPRIRDRDVASRRRSNDEIQEIVAPTQGKGAAHRAVVAVT